MDALTDAELDARAEEAWRAFHESARAYAPPNVPLWGELPDVLKRAWRAAVEAARR